MWDCVRLITLIYRELFSNCQKQFQHIKRQFAKEEMQMDNKHMKRYLTPLVNKIKSWQWYNSFHSFK